MRLLGLHDDYSLLSEADRMNLLAKAISTPPPVDKIEVCYYISCCKVSTEVPNCNKALLRSSLGELLFTPAKFSFIIGSYHISVLYV